MALSHVGQQDVQYSQYNTDDCVYSGHNNIDGGSNVSGILYSSLMNQDSCLTDVMVVYVYNVDVENVMPTTVFRNLIVLEVVVS